MSKSPRSENPVQPRKRTPTTEAQMHSAIRAFAEGMLQDGELTPARRAEIEAEVGPLRVLPVRLEGFHG
jgi:hypothetical protein